MKEILDKLSELNATQAKILAIQEYHTKQLEKQSEVLEKHADILSEQNTTLLRNTITVEQHERRSTLLEQQLNSIKEEVDDIQNHVNKVKWLGSLLGWAITWGPKIIAFVVAIFGLSFLRG